MRTNTVRLTRRGLTAAFALASALLTGTTVHAQQPTTARPAAPTRPATTTTTARPATARPVTTPVAPATTTPAPTAAPATTAQPTGPAAQTAPTPAAQVTPTGPAAATTQPAATGGGTLRLAVSSQLNGQVASVVCGDNPPTPAFVTTATEFAGEPDALALDAGDLVGASVVGRYAVEHDAAGLAGAVRAMGIRALAVGHRDLAMARPTFVAAAQAFAARDIRYVLTNLRCAGAATSFCENVVDASDDPLILDSPYGRVAYLAVASPSVLQYVARDRASGVTLEAPKDAITRAAAAARGRGARWVVVAYDPEYPGSQEDTFRLAEELTEDARVDVLLVNDISEHITSVEVARSGAQVVATRQGHVTAVEVGGGRLARNARSGTAVADVATLATSTHEWLCTTRNQPLRGATLTSELTRDQFADFFLNVLRDQAHAEVAVLNRGAVQGREIFPLRGGITALNLEAALPFEDRLYVGRVKGSVLKALATSSRAGRFYLRGIVVDDGTVKINGRTVDDAAEYTVVTTGFVVDGGEGGLGDGAGELPIWGDRGPREVFRAWLEQPHTGDITALPSDPARHTRWNFRATLDGQFTLTYIAPPTDYDSPQLTRTDTTQFRFESQFRADADHPTFTWENGLRLQYGLAQNGPDPRGFIENLDLIDLRSVFTLRGLSGGRWYVPVPYAEAFVETEFNVPDPEVINNARTYHHLRLRPSLGARFQPATKFSVGLGVGMDWLEVLDSNQDPTYAIIVGTTLLPMTVFTLRGRPVEFEFAAEATLRNAFSTTPSGCAMGAINATTGCMMGPIVPKGRDVQVTGRTRIAVPVFDWMSLTATYSLFVRGVHDFEPNYAHDFVVGLRFGYTRALQTF